MNRPGALIYAKDVLGLDINDSTTQSNKQQPDDGIEYNYGDSSNGEGGDSGNGNAGNGNGSNSGTGADDGTDTETEEPTEDEFDTFLLVSSHDLLAI